MSWVPWIWQKNFKLYCKIDERLHASGMSHCSDSEYVMVSQVTQISKKSFPAYCKQYSVWLLWSPRRSLPDVIADSPLRMGLISYWHQGLNHGISILSTTGKWRWDSERPVGGWEKESEESSNSWPKSFSSHPLHWAGWWEEWGDVPVNTLLCSTRWRAWKTTEETLLQR